MICDRDPLDQAMFPENISESCKQWGKTFDTKSSSNPEHATTFLQHLAIMVPFSNEDNPSWKNTVNADNMGKLVSLTI